MDLRVLYILLFLVSAVTCDLLNTAKKNHVNLPPCDVCKVFVNSFKKGIERTSRGNFAGGDTAWEEEKLGSYYRSEVRLVEIQEKLCLDVQEGESQCHTLAENSEYHVEHWWFKKQDEEPDLEKFLCITALKLCCEPGQYGSECDPCPGYPDNICGGKGNCKGSGTRDGSGQCVCNTGYAGKLCDRCAVNYFNTSDKDDKISCSPCHKSCQSGCTDGSPKGCKDCKPGWQMEPSVGCVDINECKTSKNVCQSNEVCINNEGSFICRDVAHLGRKDPGKWVRYVTYAGFIIATGVFLRKNLLLGSLIGVIAAVYVSASEIIMNDLIDIPKWNLKNWFSQS
ncbi:hypothetical protein R5R35_005600 [Gryllus longicercus]